MNSVDRGDKRPRDDQTPQFMILDKAPILLRTWFENMGYYGQGVVIKHVGFLKSLLYVKPRRDLIEALVPFWDPSANVFRFADFELTPTLEEIGAFMGKGRNLHQEEPMIPKHVSSSRFLELLHIRDMQMGCLNNGWVPLDFLYKRYGQKEGFDLYQKELLNNGCRTTWEKHSYQAFIVAFLGIMVFPRRGRKIDINLAAVLRAFEKKPNITLVPMILADIYRALTRCKNGADYFEGCNILLQMWMLEHIRYHPFAIDFKVEWNDYIKGHEKRMKDQHFSEGIANWGEYLKELTVNQIVWNYHWFPSKEVIYMSSFRPFIILMGLRGVQPYVPLRVMRQLGRYQPIPQVEDMREFTYEFHPEVPLRESEIFKIWGGCILSGFHDMVKDRDRGEVDHFYSTWFHNQPPLRVMPERSAKGPVDQEAVIEARIKQARIEVEENYQQTLYILSEDLKKAKEELAQRQLELEEKVKFSQKRVMEEQLSTIQTLYEDLGIVTGAMEQQQSDFEKEKAALMHTQSRLETQVKASMERERQIAKCFTARQIEFETERNQWAVERGILQNQVEELQTQEDILRQELHTTQHWVQNCHGNMEEAREQLFQLRNDLLDVYDGYLHRDNESLGRQARVLAPHLPKALSRVYSSLESD